MKTPYYDYMFSQVNSITHDPTSHPYFKHLANIIRKNINDSRIFKIPTVLSQMFLLTDPIKTHLLPFETVFLEQFIKTEGGIIKGICLYQLKEEEKIKLPNPYEDVVFLYANVESNEMKYTILFLLSEGQKEKRERFVLEPVSNELIDSQDKLEPEIKKIVYNFLCFVNSPDIEYMVKTDTQRETEIRIRKGKPPRPTIANIRLTNPLIRYINKQKTGIKMIYSHRFWVRGHWRHLKSQKFINKRWSKIWVKPHIKGEGLLIPKKYELIGG